MIQRKVIQQGPLTLLTSLPRVWIKRNKVSKGDYVNIEDNGSNLIVSKGTVKSRILKKTIRTTKFNPELVRRLYRQNYDQITIQIPPKYTVEYKQFINNLIGADIVSEENNNLTISIGISKFEITFIQLVKQTEKIILESLQELTKCIKGKEKLTITEINFRKSLSVKRIDYYIRKNQGTNELQKQQFEIRILGLLEDLFNTIIFIYSEDLKYVNKFKGKAILIRYLEKVQENISESTNILQKFDLESEEKLISELKFMNTKMLYHLNNSDVTGSIMYLGINITQSIIKIVRTTGNYYEAITEV
jgi:phosphate uptake regulator